MKTGDRQAALVGLFAGGALAILVGGVIAVGELHDSFTPKLTVHTTFEDVAGLKEGDNVWYAGVKVGLVHAIEVDGDREVKVELRVDRRIAPHLHTDTLARVGSDGLIGNRIVVLDGGTPGSEEVADGGEIASSRTLSSEDVLATLQQNNTNLLAVTGDLRDLTSGVSRGEGTLGKLARDGTLYDRATSTATSLDAASARAASATQSLDRFAANLNQEGTLAHDLATDRETYGQLRAAVGDIQAASHTTNDATARLSAELQDASSPLGTLLHDQEAAEDFKTTLGNLSEGSELLTEDLQAAQSNFLLSGYFRHKARGDILAAERKAEATRKEHAAEGTR